MKRQRLTGILVVFIVMHLPVLEAWETLECIHMASDWTMEVPTSCKDECVPDTTAPNNLQWLQTSFIPSFEEQYPSGLPIILTDQCWIHNWACANGFVADFGCMSTNVRHPEKSIGISIGRPYYEEDGSLEPMPPVKEARDRSWETGSESFSASALGVAGSEGRTEITILKKIPYDETDCGMETRSAKAWVRFQNSRIASGYKEHRLLSGACRDGVQPGDPSIEDFHCSPEEAIQHFVSFVEHLVAKTEETVAWARGGPAPSAGAPPTSEPPPISEPATEPATGGVTAVASADGHAPATETWMAGEAPPSDIMIIGFVRDQYGQPIAGAALSVPGFDVATTSDQFGLFRLSGRGGGDAPLLAEWNPVLERTFDESAAPDEPESTPIPPVATPTAPPSQVVETTRLGAFLVVRKGATGDCIVVEGLQELGPGDVVVATHSTSEAARADAAAHCSEKTTDAETGEQPDPEPADRGPESVPDLSAPFVSPVIAVPKYDNDEATEGIFFINLDSGAAFFVDKVRSSPLDVRSRPLNQNVFDALGRPADQPAQPGEILAGEIRNRSGDVTAILLADTSTGAMSYITDLRHRSYAGTLRPIDGRPAASLAGGDGNVALIMRRSDSGRTEGAYLYDATTGHCLYLHGLGQLTDRPTVGATNALPAFDGRIAAVPMQSDGEATISMLVVDDASGDIHVIGGLEKKPQRLTVERASANLFSAFPRSATFEARQRFVLVPLNTGSGATGAILVIDVATGRLAVMHGVHDARHVNLEKSRANLYQVLPRTVEGSRYLTAVARVTSGGATVGVWVFDSISGGIAYVSSPAYPGRHEIHEVRQKGR